MAKRQPVDPSRAWQEFVSFAGWSPDAETCRFTPGLVLRLAAEATAELLYLARRHDRQAAQALLLLALPELVTAQNPSPESPEEVKARLTRRWAKAFNQDEATAAVMIERFLEGEDDDRAA
jgi:hypothetical protein